MKTINATHMHGLCTDTLNATFLRLLQFVFNNHYNVTLFSSLYQIISGPMICTEQTSGSPDCTLRVFTFL